MRTYRPWRRNYGRVLSVAQRLERHRRNLENLRGAHAPRVSPSEPSPKASEKGGAK
jgi:hypothetical protein